MKALCELVEDAFQSYFRTTIPGHAAIYTHLDALDGVVTPYFAVEASGSSAVNDDAAFSVRRRVRLGIGLVFEAIDPTDSTGGKAGTLRDFSRALRDAAWSLLDKPDLHAVLNLHLGWTFNEGTATWGGGVFPVLFSKAVPKDETRGLEDGYGNCLWEIDVIAQPTE